MSLNNLSSRLRDADKGDGRLGGNPRGGGGPPPAGADKPARFAAALERSLKALELLEKK